MNWRILVGLLFLVAGMLKIYQLIADNAAHKLSGDPIYAEVGCCVWMCVGIYLIINGLKGKNS
jgi:hypothetical protein